MTRVNGVPTIRVLLCMVLVLATLSTVFFNAAANAAQITSRSLTLQTGVDGPDTDTLPDGGSQPGGVVNHLLTFTIPTSGTIGSIKFEYCTTASVSACVTPTGLVTTSATLGAQTGQTGFTLNNTTNGSPYVTRTAASGSGAVTYRLDGVTNPTGVNESFFVRISTYASTDTTGSAVDTGSVTASTANPIVLTGTMPESIIFCTGATTATNCTATTSGNITFNQLFSPTDTAIATSQMAASTNAGFGYVITVNGPTLTSGANTIPAMASATTSTKGIGQFGMNLKANTVAAATSFPSTSADLTPASDGVNLNGRVLGDYATADTFAYVSGSIVADSDFDVSGAGSPTNSQVYTASYIVNVPGNQMAGTYNTTLTYVCTGTF